MFIWKHKIIINYKIEDIPKNRNKLTFQGLLMPLKKSGMTIGSTMASCSKRLASVRSATSSLKEKLQFVTESS